MEPNVPFSPSPPSYDHGSPSDLSDEPAPPKGCWALATRIPFPSTPLSGLPFRRRLFCLVPPNNSSPQAFPFFEFRVIQPVLAEKERATFLVSTGQPPPLPPSASIPLNSLFFPFPAELPACPQYTFSASKLLSSLSHSACLLPSPYSSPFSDAFPQVSTLTDKLVRFYADFRLCASCRDSVCPTLSRCPAGSPAESDSQISPSTLTMALHLRLSHRTQDD